CFFIHPQRAAAASSQGPATGSPNARTAFGGGGGGGGGQGEEETKKGPRRHLQGTPQSSTGSLGQAAGASQRRDANGTHDSGATVWTGRAPYSGKVTHRCRMLLSRLDAHRIPRQLHASEDEQEEQSPRPPGRSGRRTRKMMTRTRNYTTTKPCDPADAAQAARVPGIATKQLRATHNLQPAIPMRWGRIPHAG
ncbi:unnamed protein product, partial [Prorocentrum cordatum]